MWIVGERNDTTDIIAFGLNFLHVILMLLRIVAFILIINLTCKVKFLQKFIEFMGTRTWYIYLLHSYFIAATRIIVKKFEMEAIPQIILGLLMGIGAPLLISVIVKKIWILDLFFYPGKYTNKIKK